MMVQQPWTDAAATIAVPPSLACRVFRRQLPQNAIKNCRAGLIGVASDVRAGVFSYQVDDNGVGFDMKNAYSSCARLVVGCSSRRER